MDYQHFAIDRSATALSGLFLFAGAGAAAAVNYFYELPGWAWFVIVAAFCLLSIPVRIGVAKRKQKKAGIDSELLLHRTAVVTEEVYNRTNEGAIELDGKRWPVRMAGNSVIRVGTKVEIVGIVGDRLVILPVKE